MISTFVSTSFPYAGSGPCQFFSGRVIVTEL
jgi:hypothetical protein